jgi:hypothetical protein
VAEAVTEDPFTPSDGQELPERVATGESAPAPGELDPAAKQPAPLVLASEEAPPPPPDPPRRPPLVSKYTPRFRLIIGGLFGIGIGALGATLILAAGRGVAPPTSWSNWKPGTSSTAGAQEIADHVAPTYKQAGGDQLVGVTGGPLKVGDLSLPVRIAVSSSADAQSVKIARGKSVLYTLCGLGPRCSISRGKPSKARFLLLQREAFELALYSFRYLDGVENVVALLPPARGAKPTNAVFFQRDDPVFKPALDHPLLATLPSPPPSPIELASSDQGTLISSLTQPNVFCYSFQQGQDLSAFLILQPLSSDPKTPCK